MNKKKLNVVFIGRYPFPVGRAMSKRHRYYIDYLATLQEVDVCNICTWENDGMQNPKDGIYAGNVKYYNSKYPKKISSFARVAKWTNEILVERFDNKCENIAIFSSYFTIEQIPVLFKAKKMGYKVICDVVENYNATGSDASMLLRVSFKMSRLFLYSKVDAFIVISHQIEKVYRRYGKPILMLTNSAPITCVSKKHLFNTPMKVVYTGTFAPKDGLSYLVEGFDRFIRKEGRVAKLILIGKGRSDDYTECIISQNEQIERLGFVSEEELAKTQLEADVLCMTRCNSPFANYGFPFKLSEYMATGNMVLATAVGDVPLYIKDKENGLLVEPDSSDAICTALSYAYKHPKECIEFGKRGMETVRQYFSVENNGKSIFDFIERLS